MVSEGIVVDYIEIRKKHGRRKTTLEVGERGGMSSVGYGMTMRYLGLCI